MADAYRHGVYTIEQATSVLPPRRVSASIPFVVGTAPVHKLAGGIGPVNEPQLISTYQEAVTTFGYDSDWETYSLCEFFKAMFGLFSVGPMVAVNVFDPAGDHMEEVSTPESATFDANDGLTLANSGVIPDSEDVQPDGGGTSYVKGTDYSIDYPTGKIIRIDGGGITALASVDVTYDYGDPSQVADADIVGGVDAGTGKLTGLELVGQVYPMFSLVPGMIVAPGWSHVASTAVVMAAKADNINQHFKSLAIVDLPETVTKYSDAPSHKTTNNLTDELMVVCWPKVRLGTDEYWLSSQLAALMARVDAEHEDVPYKSPSNENLRMDSAVIAGSKVWLGWEQANILNGQGIVTALNGQSGWVSWGNRTAAYPGVTDVKDAMLPVRRMFNWIGNTLILTFWQKVDFPIRRRLIDTICDAANVWLNGLASREHILGGRVEFLEEENPTTDVMDGIIRFHCFVTPASPAREIEFLVEYDPEYIQTLFA